MTLTSVKIVSHFTRNYCKFTLKNTVPEVWERWPLCEFTSGNSIHCYAVCINTVVSLYTKILSNVCLEQGSHSFTVNDLGLFQNLPGPTKNFPEMFKYKEKPTVQYRKFSMRQNVDKKAIVNINWVPRNCCLFSIWTTRKMHEFQEYFFRTNVIF